MKNKQPVTLWDKRGWILRKGEDSYSLSYGKQLKLFMCKDFIDTYEITFIPVMDGNAMEIRSMGQGILTVVN